jgi:hypothetical protein
LITSNYRKSETRVGRHGQPAASNALCVKNGANFKNGNSIARRSARRARDTLIALRELIDQAIGEIERSSSRANEKMERRRN